MQVGNLQIGRYEHAVVSICPIVPPLRFVPCSYSEGIRGESEVGGSFGTIAFFPKSMLLFRRNKRFEGTRAWNEAEAKDMGPDP